MSSGFSVGYLSAYTGSEVDAAIGKISSLESQVTEVQDTLDTEIPKINEIIDVEIPAIKNSVDSMSLDSLQGVNIQTPTQGQNLTYDATERIWRNTSSSAQVGWGGILGNLEDQTDLYDVLQEKTVTTIRKWNN